MNRIEIDGQLVEIPREVENQGRAAVAAWEAEVRAGTTPAVPPTAAALDEDEADNDEDPAPDPLE